MNDEKENLREFVERWKETGKLLESLRREEIRNANLSETILALNDAFLSALWLSPNKPTSGLVEFHKILAKSK
ncbi:hypothetical protein BH20ACI4_BH20ACI4_34070 [soil metagenome]